MRLMQAVLVVISVLITLGICEASDEDLLLARIFAQNGPVVLARISSIKDEQSVGNSTYGVAVAEMQQVLRGNGIPKEIEVDFSSSGLTPIKGRPYSGLGEAPVVGDALVVLFQDPATTSGRLVIEKAVDVSHHPEILADVWEASRTDQLEGEDRQRQLINDLNAHSDFLRTYALHRVLDKGCVERSLCLNSAIHAETSRLQGGSSQERRQAIGALSSMLYPVSHAGSSNRRQIAQVVINAIADQDAQVRQLAIDSAHAIVVETPGESQALSTLNLDNREAVMNALKKEAQGHVDARHRERANELMRALRGKNTQ